MLNSTEIRKLQKLVRKDRNRLSIVGSALSDRRRCTMFRSILSEGGLYVSDIARITRTSLSLTSQHLKVLETTGLVVREKEGRTVCFRVNRDDELVRAIIKVIQ